MRKTVKEPLIIRKNPNAAQSQIQSSDSMSEQSDDNRQQIQSSVKAQGIVEQPVSSEPQQSVSSNLNSIVVLESNQYDPALGYKKGTYTMEKILKRRWNIQTQQFQYQIKWKNYPLQESTWQIIENMIFQPSLKQQLLGGSSMLAVFQRTRCKTQIYDPNSNKIIGVYQHTQKNHLLYARQSYIKRMEEQLQKIYGKVETLHKSSKLQPSNNIKLQPKQDNNISHNTNKILPEQITSNTYHQSFANEKKRNQFIQEKGYKIKNRNIIVQRLIYYPLQFDMKISILSKGQRTLITCHEMMKIDPTIGILCYKAKISYFQKWRRKNFNN